MKILQNSNFKALSKIAGMKPEEIIEIIKKSGLTGRGGADFPTGLKLEFTRNSKGEKYVIANADEGEPGTFKDKLILEKNPNNIIEGMIIAGYAIGSNKGYLYLRGEYSYLKNKLQKVISNATKIANKLKIYFDIEIISGAGAYVCGDETAIIESIEGNRGNPRIKPPFPANKGLFNKPTLINNVETLANIPLIILDKNWNNNLRLFSLSGNVTKPGVYELESGFSLKKLINLGKPKNNIKAVYFGCSGGCIPYENIKLDSKTIKEKGAMLGSCTIIAIDEKHDLVDIATNIAKFFEYESCGKCTPCREGTMRVLELLEKISLKKAAKKDLDLLEELCRVIASTSLCELGQSSTNHITTALKYFRNEFTDKLK